MTATSFEVPIQIVLQAAKKASAYAQQQQQKERNRQIQEALDFNWIQRLVNCRTLQPITQSQAEQYADRPNCERSISENPIWSNRCHSVEIWANQLIAAASIATDKCGTCHLSPKDAEAIKDWTI